VTPKQEAFIAEYMVDKNATQAAIRAGYKEKAAYAVGAENLKKPQIASEIERRLKIATDKAGLSVELVLASLARELSFDPAQLYDERGNLKSIHDIPVETRKCLVGMETAQMGGNDSPVTVQKVKWVDQSKAREQAMKHLGMFERDNDQKTDPIRALIMAIQGRSVIGPAR
jgi:phage terminase small subunit